MGNTTIRYRDVAPTSSIEAAIQRWVERLEVVSAQFEACEVVIGRNSRAFAVDVTVAIAGTRVQVDHDPGRSHAHDDIYVAVADSFRGVWRVLRDRFAIGTMPLRKVA